MEGSASGSPDWFPWTAIGLLSLLVVEVLTSAETDHPRQTIIAGILLAVATMIAWGVCATVRSLPWFSGLDSPGTLLPPSWLQGIPFLIAGGLVIWGRAATRRFPLLRLVFPGSRASLIALFVWGGICAAAISTSTLLLLGPACVILSLDGIRRVAPSMYREPLSYAPAVMLVALLVIVNQAVSFASVQPAMAADVERRGEVEAIAAWMRTHVPAGTRVGAEPAGRLGYMLRADLPVERVTSGSPAPYIMVESPPDGKYAEVYRPSPQARVAVFKRMLKE